MPLKFKKGGDRWKSFHLNATNMVEILFSTKCHLLHQKGGIQWQQVDNGGRCWKIVQYLKKHKKYETIIIL